MSRIRTIKPEFFRHEALFEAEREFGIPLRLAFSGLWCCCDRLGRFKWRPRALKLDVLPYDELDFSRVLDALESRGFLVRYEIGGEAYGWIPSFLRHQHINPRESASTIPAPPGFTDVDDPKAPDFGGSGGQGSRVNDASATRQHLAHGEGEGKRKGKERNGSNPPLTPPPGDEREREIEEIDFSEGFEEAWQEYPARAGSNSKADALREWRARRLGGNTVLEMVQGVRRYRAYCEALGKMGTQFVMQGSRFFGDGLQFLEPWTPTQQNAPPSGGQMTGRGINMSGVNYAENQRFDNSAPGKVRRAIAERDARLRAERLRDGSSGSVLDLDPADWTAAH